MPAATMVFADAGNRVRGTLRRVALPGILWLAILGQPQECPAAPAPAGAAPLRLHQGPGFPSAEDFYPEQAAPAGQEGAVVVQVCLDAHGGLTAALTVAGSSGQEALDAAAIETARAGQGHHSLSCADGRPAAGCARFRVSFQLPSDPRWPLLSRRLGMLDRVFWAKAHAVLPETTPEGDAAELRHLAQQWETASGSCRSRSTTI